MKKRLLITLDFPPEKGGIQHYLEQIVEHTYTADDLVIAGVCRNHTSKKAYPCPVNYTCSFLHRINNKFSLINILFLAYRHIVKQHYFVECGNVYAAVIPYLFSFFYKVKYAVYTYGTEITGLKTKSLKAIFLKRVLSEAETLYVLGPYTHSLLKRSGIDKKVKVVSPKIDYQPALFKMERKSDPFKILSVGRLVYHKGHDILIRAVAQLPSELKWSLTIIGRGPLEKKLNSLSANLGVQDKVNIYADADDTALESEYKEASLFVLPSREDRKGTEGFGIVLLEAMNHGIPIIASNSGGIPDVLDNGRCGELVEPNSPESLALAIQKLATNQDVRSEYVRRASHRLEEHYVW